MPRIIPLAVVIAATSTIPVGATALLAQATSELPAADRSIAVDVVSQYSIGGINGQDWQVFGTPVEVAFDATGTLRILDSNNFRVVAVDTDGNLLWEAGGEGGGPGEFGMPMAMAVGPEGTTVVYDLGHQAFVEFTPDGAYVDQVPHGMEQGLPGGDLAADPLGGVVFTSAGTMAVRRGPEGTVTQAGAEGGEPIRRVLSDGRDGVAYNAWRMPPAPTEEMSTGGSSGGFRMQIPAARAFEPELFYAPTVDGGLVVADTVDYTLKIVDVNGAIERVIHRPIEPREVGRAEREAEKERRLAELEESGGPQVRMMVRGGPGGSGSSIQTPGRDAMRGMLEGRIENMVFADEIPVIDGLGFDPWTNTIWIRRAGRRIGETGPIDLVSTDGQYLGTLDSDERMPAAFGPNGLIAYIETDEFDVTTIEVVRLGGPR